MLQCNDVYVLCCVSYLCVWCCIFYLCVWYCVVYLCVCVMLHLCSVTLSLASCHHSVPDHAGEAKRDEPGAGCP